MTFKKCNFQSLCDLLRFSKYTGNCYELLFFQNLCTISFFLFCFVTEVVWTCRIAGYYNYLAGKFMKLFMEEITGWCPSNTSLEGISHWLYCDDAVYTMSQMILCGSAPSPLTFRGLGLAT